MIDLTTYTDADLDALRIQVLTEQERRRTIATADADQAQRVATYTAAVATEPALDGTAVPAGGYAPGRLYRFAGIAWRNTSRAWLPVGPAAYPLGWQQVDPPPVGAPAWSAASVAYKVGDLVTYTGKTWRCLQAHTSNTGWTPVAAVSLWTLA